jgi:hypothetical protein
VVDRDDERSARPLTVRRVVVGIAALAMVAAVAGVALASGGNSPDRVSVRAAANDPTSTSTLASTTALSPTTTSAPREVTSAAEPSPSTAGTSSSPTADTGAESTTTGPPPPDPDASPWPEGTTMGLVGLDGNVEFTPATAVEGTSRAFIATLVNPTDHWVFGEVGYRGLALHLYSHYDEYAIPTIVEGYAPGTAPEFQHETPAGPVIGLLLAPHASYSFSGRVRAGDPCATTDYVVHADIIHAPVGVATAIGQIVTGAGSYTVTDPTPDPYC